MISRIVLYSLVLSSLVGCKAGMEAPEKPEEVFDPDFTVTPNPGSWPEFHGDGANHGALFVATNFAIAPKWSVEVGPVMHSSPVVGGDGTVYVGNVDGQLFAIDRLGFVRWAVNFREPIDSTPAASAGGLIYVITTRLAGPDEYQSTLRILSPSGALLRSVALPGGYTTSSPKVWHSGEKEYVFLYARRGFDESSLLAFDSSGALLDHEIMFCNTPATGAVPIWDDVGVVFEVIWDGLFGGGPGVDFDPAVSPPDLTEEFGWIEASAAIVDEPNLTRGNKPIIVLVDKACFLKAFEWEAPTLVELWSKRHSFLFQSTPALIGSSFVLGARDGHVRAYDVLTGDEAWDVDLGIGPIMGTPASFGGVVFVAGLEGARMLDAGNGSVLQETSFASPTVASPALSASHVIVSLKDELTTYSFDFTRRAHANDGRGGLSSPAIGADGTIYAIATVGGDRTLLRAYGGLTAALPAPEGAGSTVIAP